MLLALPRPPQSLTVELIWLWPDGHAGKAHPKDLALLVFVLREGCPFLTTFNVKDYAPGDPNVEVLQPGALVRRVRALLAQFPTQS